MRCNPLRWWWGLLPVAALVWLAFIWEREPIQQDLRVRTHQALSAAGLTWAGTAFDGRDGLLRGIAFRDEHPDQASKVVGKVWGVRVVEQKVDLIDFVDNYAWAAATNDKTITLTGYVPDEEARIKLRELVQARFPGFEIDDRTTLARGAPAMPAWTGAIGFGLDRLAQLKSGNLQLSGLGLSISGEAVGFGAYKSAVAALASAVPEGVTIVKNNIRPPIVSPYTWGSSRSATHLILSGHVPGDEQRERIFALAKKAHPNVVIIDRMETGAGAPQGWEQAVETMVAQIARLQTGEGKLSDLDLSLKGEAPDEDTANAVTTEIIEAIPKAFRFRHDIDFPKPKPPLVSPFTTSIDASGDAIRLTGFVPDEAARTTINKAARKAFPDKEIYDAMALGSGEPEGWRRCVLAGVEATGKLGTGTATLSDKLLRVTATTANEELAAALPGDVRAATTRACESRVALTLDLPEEPDLDWRAIYDGDGNLLLDGEVPDIATLTLLLSTARKQFPDADIENRMKVAGGYPVKWQKTAAHGITLLRLLRRGEASLSGQALVIAGESADTAAATAIKDRLVHNLPKNYFGRDLIEVKSDAMIWAEVEAKRKAEEEASTRAKAEAQAEAKAKKQAAEDANQRRLTNEAATRRSTDAAAAARRMLQQLLAQREAYGNAPDQQDNSDAIADARRKLEEILARRAAESADQDASTQRAVAKEAERREIARIEAERRAEEDATTRRRAEAAARRKLDQVFARREAERVRKEKEARRRAEDEAEAQRIRDAQEKREAQEKLERQAQEREEAERMAKEEAARSKAAEAAESEAKAAAKAEAAIARDRRTTSPQRQAIPAAAFDCQKRLSTAIKSGVILFDYASSELSAHSRPTLDQLAKIAKSCPDVDLAVEGHTDSIGKRGDNRRLSLLRSKSVIDYLVHAGIARSRLRPVGYGEKHPVAPNNSSANRARNRRIEFSIDING